MLKHAAYALKALIFYPFAALYLLVSVVFCIVLFLPMIMGAVIGAYQIFLRLYTGSWHPYPLRLAFEALGIDLGFAYDPHSWHVLAKIVRTLCELPLSPFLLMAGILLALLGAYGVADAFGRLKGAKQSRPESLSGHNLERNL